MIASSVKLAALVAILVAAHAMGAAVKGRESAPEPAAVKGTKQLASPARLLEAAKGATARLEQVEQVEQVRQLPEQAPEEPAAPVAAPTKSRYEAKTQLKEEAPPAKGGAPAPAVQKVEEAPLEQVQVVRQEELPSLQQQPAIPQLQVQQVQQEHLYEDVRQQRIEQVQETKGAPAPLAEAEPYAFSYQVDGSTRSESGDTKGVVRGQYTLSGGDGSSRVVDYVADQNGFRASVNTNEFGTEARSPAGVNLRSSQPEAQDITLRLEGKTRQDLLPPAAPKPELKKAAEPVGAKGQRLVLVQEQLARDETQQQQQLEFVRQEELPAPPPAKGLAAAELRAPKASLPAAETKQRGFESATAHRALRPAVRAPAARPRPLAAAVPPAVLVRALPQPPQHPLRAYPPTPVQSAYRQRVPLYAPAAPIASYEDDSLEAASFEPAPLIAN